jgi:hypothetical protein
VIDFGDSKTFWLNITNIGLGLVTLACLLLAARAFLGDLLDRVFATRTAEQDVRMFVVPVLGTTMADGGEPISKDSEKHEKTEDPR